MGAFVVGEVLVLDFPFSDLKRKKKRPVIVVGQSDYGNIIVAQITSKLPPDASGIPLDNSDFLDSSPLISRSYIRANKIFTADPQLVLKSIGVINMKKQKEIGLSLRKTFKELL